MATSGYVVHEILAHAAIPANRPIDHMRRAGTAFSLGTVGGTLLSVLALPDFRLGRLVAALAVMALLGALGLVPWLMKPKVPAQAVEAVGRVLGTKEPPEMRLVKRGRRTVGILVPVVCRPVGMANTKRTFKTGEGDFRGVIELPVDDAKSPSEPAVGSLLPLMQTDRGMGTLALMPDGEATPGQRELMAQLEARPKSLKNTAPILPIRRGSLDRVPGWAAAQFWTAAVIGAIVAAMIVLGIGR